MLKIPKLFSIMIVLIILLAGCDNPFAKQQGETGVKQSGTKSSIKTEAPVKKKALTCNVLKSAKRNNECKEMINEFVSDALYREIIETFDLKRCKELLTADDTKRCTERIKQTGIKGPLSDEEVNNLHTAMRGTDLAACDAFKDEGAKTYCSKSVNQRIEQDKVNEIIEAGDVKRCDEIKDEDNKQFCKEVLGGNI